MSDKFTKDQKKKQKKKDAKKRKKIENSNKNEVEDGFNEEQEIARPVAEQTECLNRNDEEKEDDNFESELCWCIEQLQLGLKNKKPSKDQTEKATKIIKLLRSEKTTKVRKRHAMRTTFGDYRKKMAAEAKQQASQVVKDPKISSVADERTNDSVFLKPKSQAFVEEPTENEDKEDGKWHFKKSDNDFQFSFPDPQ